MDRLNTLAIHKASNFSFNMPIKLALLLVKNGNERYTQEAEFNHICLELGKLIQFEVRIYNYYINSNPKIYPLSTNSCAPRFQRHVLFL